MLSVGIVSSTFAQNIVSRSVVSSRCSSRPWTHSFIHSLCSLSYGWSNRLPKRVLHSVRSSASSFSFQYPVFSL